MPNLYIISGCNGAGKTTASFTVLPEMLNCKEFVNADEIAKGISPFNPESVAIQAGKIMLTRIDELLNNQKDFAIETTLTTKSYLNTIARAKSVGYKITLLFFWLNDVELAIERVKIRVSEGGHNIPEEVIRRRYFRGMMNLKLFCAEANYWLIIDSSDGRLQFIAEGNLNKEITIFEKGIWSKLNLMSNGK
ncbi:zeta toxin family protein [Pedobacter fastidiosus]|uniref:Zeta toxin family protein n=1 Tax=Pedobacter fastidiosus TaxID=2765361 RepID=A0ABR7KPA8_9SPHI|nr:zeta toxin family protein [Pedobacter fastidiosus]MBC6109924.1 zeta toxin family protein [Pedobacter fastidiosus]